MYVKIRSLIFANLGVGDFFVAMSDLGLGYTSVYMKILPKGGNEEKDSGCVINASRVSDGAFRCFGANDDVKKISI